MSNDRGYRQHEHELGTQLLTIRTRVALTQTALADAVGVHRRSVQNWETGVAYPKAETLQRMIAIFLDHGAFTAGNERAEVEALWAQAVKEGPRAFPAFDVTWFADTFGLVVPNDQHGEQTDQREAEVGGSASFLVQPASSAGESASHSLQAAAFVDWGESIAVPTLYGRDTELETLHSWVVDSRCRLVAIVGLGGMGKSSLAITFAQRALSQFEVVLFRSLQNGPPLADLLDYTIRAVSQQQTTPPDQVSDKIALLVQLFRERRCLLILDNLESIMQPGELTGTYRSGYAVYGDLLRRLGEREHQSCLLLTSREKPAELGPLEGHSTPVRTLHLGGLDDSACQIILEAKEIGGTATDVGALARLYGGNPLALHLVAEPIRELFGGDVGAFLAAGDAFFNGVGMLLAQQFARSTPLEQAILYWLAIERELVPLSALLANLGDAVSQRAALGALESLRHRMQIERSPDRPDFTLQPVILEYVTDQLIAAIRREIVAGRPELMQQHALMQATASEYVRRSQERRIATPLLEQLAMAYGDAGMIEQQLVRLLDYWRDLTPLEQGYGPGNIVNLLRLLRGHLRGLDLARLAIWQTYLQGAELQDSSLADATIHNSVFTESFDALIAVAVTSSGEYWAAAGRRGEVRVWAARGPTLRRAWRAHTDMIWALAFSPDGRTLASGSWDGRIKLWDVASGGLLWWGRHASLVKWVAFSPDGGMLASSGNDGAVYLWDTSNGALLQTLLHTVPIPAISWRPDGQMLATGDREGNIRLWALPPNGPASCVQMLAGHTNWVDGLAFAPDGIRLASVGWDRVVKVWDISAIGLAADQTEAGVRLLQTLAGHTDWVLRVVWSHDGLTLASCSRDRTIRLWNVEQGSSRMVLQGHTAGVDGLAFTPDSRSLLTGSEDGTLRLWDIASGQALRVIQGFAASLYDVDWSPDGRQLVGAGSDMLVTVYPATGAPPQTLEGQSGVVFGVGWSPDGRWLASSEWDNIIRLWDPVSGTARRVLQHPEDSANVFYSLAWSPDGQRLACGTNRRGVHVFELIAHRPRWAGPEFPAWIRHVAWRPDGAQLAGGGDDGAVYVWDATDGRLLQRLADHPSMITSLAWSPSGTRLASTSGSSEGGELLVWDVQRGKRLQAAAVHPRMIYAVAWGSSEDIVVSGAGDGMLRWWDIQRGVCLRVRAAHQGTVQSLRRSPDGTQLASCGDDGAIMLWDLPSGAHLRTLRRDRPYERLNISGISGLTEAQHASLIALGAVDRPGD